MKRRFGKVLGLSGVGAALLVAAWGQAAAAAPTTRPAAATTRPAKLPEAVRKVMAHAPVGACGVIHFDVAAMRPALLRILNANKDLAEEFKFDAKAAAAFIAKTDSVDVFICIRRRDMEPDPVLVLRGKAGLKELLALPKDEPIKPTSAGNGRYDLGKGRNPPRLIIGAEAKDLAKGLLIVGRKNVVTDEVVAKLGEKPDPELRQVLAKVKADAAIWVAASMEKLSAHGAPKHVIGGIDAAGKAASGFSVVFAEDTHADEALEELSKYRDILGGTPVTKLKGARLALSLPKGPQVLDTVAAGIVAYGQAVKRDGSAMRVRDICSAARMHDFTRRGPAPSLLELVQNRRPEWMLISPVSGRKLKTDEKGNPIGPFDYIYVAVPTQAGAGLPPANRVLVYERPENYKNKGTMVGYANGHTEWVKMEKFKEDLKATQKWLAEQAR